MEGSEEILEGLKGCSMEQERKNISLAPDLLSNRCARQEKSVKKYCLRKSCEKNLVVNSVFYVLCFEQRITFENIRRSTNLKGM